MNNVPGLKEIGKAAWNFISAVYKSSLDSLITDKDNCSFQQKVKLKFSPNIQETKNKSKNNENINKPASFIKLLPPILAKTPKEVNEISKFFKKNS